MILGNDVWVHAVARYHSLLDEAEAERRAGEARPVAPRRRLLDPIRLLVALILGTSR